MTIAEFKTFLIILFNVTLFSGSIAYGLQYILKWQFKEQARIFGWLTVLVGLAIAVCTMRYFGNSSLLPILAYIVGGFFGDLKYGWAEDKVKRQADLNELQSRFKLAFQLDDGKATVAISEFHPKVINPFIEYCLNEGLNVITERHHRTDKVFLHISR